MRNRILREARELERRALELERPDCECPDPLGAAALFYIAALIYRSSERAGPAEKQAARAAELKAEQAERREEKRREAEPQAELF